MNTSGLRLIIIVDIRQMLREYIVVGGFPQNKILDHFERRFPGRWLLVAIWGHSPLVRQHGKVRLNIGKTMRIEDVWLVPRPNQSPRIIAPKLL